MNATVSPKISRKPAPKSKKKPFYKSLLIQVLFAIFLGVAFGAMYPSVQYIKAGLPNAGAEIPETCYSGFDAAGKCLPGLAEKMKPLGDAFINLIKMLIAPIIFCTIVSGIAGMGDVKQVGRVGAKAILWFEVVTTIALIMGWIMVELVKPGSTMHITAGQVDSAVSKK